MAGTVEFRSNGQTAPGYIALPSTTGKGPGVLVIQKWGGWIRA